MSSQCSGALPTELRWMAAPRGANATRVEAGSEPASPSLGIRFLAALFAGLVGLYHAEHCLAEVITGSTGDGVVSVSWEYDLEQATGQVTIENLGLPLNTTGELLYLAGLIPDGATSILYDPAVVSIDPCAVMGAGPPPLPHVFADLPPGAQTVITFETCTPTDEGGPLRSEPACGPAIAAVEYGDGFVLSGVGCFVFPHGTLTGFVTVAPIPPRAAGGYDRDIDPDDSARFQRDYTGPTPP